MQNQVASSPPAPLPRALTEGPTWERLEDQIEWYDRRSRQGQRFYIRLKLIELIVAASLPVVAGLSAAAWIIGALASGIVVLEGAQHLYQLQEHWITYRSTCESLRHERFLYLAGAGPYAALADAPAALAERVEGLVSQEHAQWATSHQEELRRS